jgi:hypothetical protein
MNPDAEKGSALLIVFLFAAIVAATLYMEMPVTVFEAKRQKEQITIDHGKEYAHAVKLFVRKIGRYPSSLDELQDTNRMRFLRHRFKDPLTGNDDWRLLHAGPGGTLLDSKVKPAGSGTFQGNTHSAGFGTENGTPGSSNPGQQAANNQTTGAASQSDFPMAGSIAAEAPASTAAIPVVPQRRPAIAANGAANSEAGTAVSPDETPGASLVPPGEQSDVSAQAASNSQGEASGAGNPGVTNAGTSNEGTGAAGGHAESGPAGGLAGSGVAGNGPAGGLAGSPGDASTGQGQNTANGVQNLLNKMGGSTGQTNSGTGNLSTGGGIAGVAIPDKVSGVAIKAVNDQHKYALWEFYYDPTQDTLKIPIAGQQPATNTGNMGAPGVGTGSAPVSPAQTSDTSNSANGSATTGGVAPSNTTQSQPY